jgi:hypothetical protein
MRIHSTKRAVSSGCNKQDRVTVFHTGVVLD